MTMFRQAIDDHQFFVQENKGLARAARAKPFLGKFISLIKGITIVHNKGFTIFHSDHLS